MYLNFTASPQRKNLFFKITTTNTITTVATTSAAQVWVALLALMALSMALGVAYNWMALKGSLPGAARAGAGGRRAFFRASWIFKMMLVEREFAAGLAFSSR